MRTPAAVLWNMFRVTGQAVISILVSMVLARILTPTEIGISAIVFIFLGISELITSSGISAAFIHQKEVTKDTVKILFSIAMVYALLVFSMIWVFAVDIAAYFEEDQLVDMLRLLSLSLFPLTLASVCRGYFMREKDFKILMKIDLSSYIIGFSMIGITLALLDFGEWSTVIASVVTNVIISIQLFVKAPISFGLSFSFKKIKQMWVYSFGVNLTQIIGFTTLRLTETLIAKVLGKPTLAYYATAQTNAMLPFNKIAVSLSMVMFSVYSRSQEDLVFLRSQYIKAIKLISATAVPIIAGMYIAAEYIIIGMYGAQWYPSIEAFQVLCIAVGLYAVLHLAGAVIQATNNVYQEVWVQGVTAVVYIGLLFSYAEQGLVFICYLVVGHAAVLYLVMAVLVNRIIDLSWREYFTAQLPSVVIAIPVMLAEYVVIEYVLTAIDVPHAVGLLMIIAAAGLTYLACIVKLPDGVIGNVRSWGLGHYGHKLPPRVLAYMSE